MNSEIDQFDRLPDALLRTIFNKLHDAQSLTRCGVVCKRFAAVSTEVDTVRLAIPRKRSSSAAGRSPRAAGGGGYKSFFRTLVRKIIARPVQFLLSMVKSTSSMSEVDCSYYSPNAVLKNFKEIRFLQIQLPGHGDGIGLDGKETLLRWRGEFGSELDSCVIVGANSLRTISQSPSNGQAADSEVLLNDDELKMRVVWTISCLIAASARHYLAQKVIAEHQLVRDLAVVDGNKQGKLSMNREQIEQLRTKLHSSAAKSESSVLDRVEVPAVKMKLWYVPELELPGSGRVMEGATLVVITPVGAGKKPESDGDLVGRAFSGGEGEGSEDEKIFGEAVKEMLKKKKSYTLEMNSF